MAIKIPFSAFNTKKWALKMSANPSDRPCKMAFEKLLSPARVCLCLCMPPLPLPQGGLQQYQLLSKT